MFGSHLSIAGALTNALDEAAGLGLDTVQIFTKNQQQWKARPLDEGMANQWRARVAELGWEMRTVSHASYLINLASPDDELWRKSIDLMTDEIERCERLGIPFLVHHPGAYTSSTRAEGLARIAAAYRDVFGRTKGYRTVSCLENTVGGGSVLGRDFVELGHLRGAIIEATGATERFGFCCDTCHAHAGGYDLSTPMTAAAAFAEWDDACGLEHIRVLHLNDSKTPLGSRRDRHEHIGVGSIGLAGFEALLAIPIFADRPKIMETPKEEHEPGVQWDVVNLGVLKSLSKSEPSSRSSRTSNSARKPSQPKRT